MYRTDLAHEIASESGLTLEETTMDGIAVTRVAINKQASEKTGKPEGTYITLSRSEKSGNFGNFADSKAAETSVLARVIAKMLSAAGKAADKGRVLVTGLGNKNVTPDSLGVRAAEKVLVTAHLAAEQEFTELGLREVCVIKPGVMAQTGLESAQQLKLIADGIKPTCLIAIDSLACNERQRLAKTIQITDTGIAPGSGVKNERKEFSERVFGVPVIAVGVPTVIDLDGFMVVPRDIDTVIAHYAKVISGALNRALNPELDESEIESLLV